MHTLIRYLKPYWRFVLLALFLAAVNQIFETFVMTAPFVGGSGRHDNGGSASAAGVPLLRPRCEFVALSHKRLPTRRFGWNGAVSPRGATR